MMSRSIILSFLCPFPRSNPPDSSHYYKQIIGRRIREEYEDIE